MNGLIDGLKKQGGCTLILMGWFVFGVGYMIYWFLSGGNPDVVKFRKENVPLAILGSPC